MRSVVYRDSGFVFEERAKPEIIDGTDAVVKVTLSSICTSDLHIRNGAVPKAKQGIIIGHEAVGIVESAGPEVRKVRPGDRVAVNVETFCGHCFFCERGYVNNCTDPNGGWAIGCRIDGAEAEYLRVPYADSGLNVIPDGVSDESALFTGDLMSTGYWAADIGEIEKGSVVAVIGAGPTGVCCAMCASLYEPSAVVMIDVSEERLRFAERNGIGTHRVHPDEALALIKGLTDGRGADTVIEAAGGEDTFRLSWELCRPNAVDVIVAMYERDQILPLPQMYGKNIIFKTGGVDASHCDDILALISEGKMDPSCLITHRFDLKDIMRAYELFEKREDGVMKIAVRP